MSHNHAIRIESHRYSAAQEPCGTGHSFSLNVLGIATPSIVPPTEQDAKDTYIPGAVYGVRLNDADTGSVFYELGKSLSAEHENTKGMAVRGTVLGRPQDENRAQIERDEEIAGAIQNLLQAKEDKPVVVTFLDKFALLQGVFELSEETHPQSYGMLITAAIASVLEGINNSRAEV